MASTPWPSQVDTLVKEGIPSNRIIVGGFSQGAALALLSVVVSAKKLAGAVMCSGWVALQAELGALLADSGNKDTSLLWCHGAADQVVLCRCQEIGSKALEGQGLNVQCKRYAGMEHSSCGEEMEHIKDFIKGLLD